MHLPGYKNPRAAHDPNAVTFYPLVLFLYLVRGQWIDNQGIAPRLSPVIS